MGAYNRERAAETVEPSRQLFYPPSSPGGLCQHQDRVEQAQCNEQYLNSHLQDREHPASVPGSQLATTLLSSLSALLTPELGPAS